MRILLALAALIATQALAETVAIKVGAIVDPITGTEARDQTVIVDDGLIRAVGHGLAIRNGARVIDLSTEFLIPGLVLPFHRSS